MEQDVVIDVKALTKVYKLYKKPEDRIKEVLMFRGGKQLHREHYALNKVSFTVKRGETIGIIGKNGSGKSTLLKILSSVLTPSYGSVEVKGKVTSLLELGAGFNPQYSGIENIYLNGTIMGFTKEQMDSKLPDILRFADIGDYVYQPVKSYSSGMFARLAFSVMAHMEPDILIVDEALAVGDTFFQQKCNQYMKNEMLNVTKLLVTHDMNSIANLADRCLVLSNGSLVYEGEPIDCIEYYIKSVHTETFSGSATYKKAESSSKDVSKSKHSDVKWFHVEPDKLGGALDARITRCAIHVDGEEYKGYVQAGSKVKVSLSIQTSRSIRQGILGYIIKDKFGNAIFGENTITSNLPLLEFKDGNEESIVAFEFIWPEIKPEEYFLTLGVGEGEHETQHVIQCWAHNIYKFDCISPKRTVHCLFNNKIESITPVVRGVTK